MIKLKLWALPILLLCLCASSWGACTSSGGYSSYSCKGGKDNVTWTSAWCSGSFTYSCIWGTNPVVMGTGTFTGTGSGKYCYTINTYNNLCCQKPDTYFCDTQAEADSMSCELKPGMKWANGACSAPVCETSCSSQKASCTNWKDSATYVVDVETGDTTFSCVGYCKTARMTHTDSVEAMDDSFSIIYRKNFADSVKVSYGENCVSPADTTGGGNPQDVGMTYFVSFNGIENELDTAGVSFVKGLYNQSCESTLYRGIKNGRYVFWYSPNDIPEGVTNVVRIR